MQNSGKMNLIGEFLFKIIGFLLTKKTMIEFICCPTKFMSSSSFPVRGRPSGAAIFCSKAAAYVVSNAAVDAFMAYKIIFLFGRLFFFLLLVLAFFLYIWEDHISQILAQTSLHAGYLFRNPTSAAAAYSFPSYSASRFRYDVFISFRGPDTRNGFASHLFSALCRAKIKTFMDHKLEKGEDIARGLFDAIDGSKISVVVLSENYASSTWCLAELAKIMKCKRRGGHRVLPVFYGIKPREVRRQTGSYEAALVKHESDSTETGTAEKVKRWRDDLTEAANLFGYDSDEIRPEAKLVDEIVEDVLEILQKRGLFGIFCRR
ncbi:PREDICTED: TMV resistance protein N-like isoform X1 [Tarenaya hassleriana]|uniref:TMV resistance protein N-like isoform X1 n=1 Tax=Tarenaya hassleriana TaxID=28532 RepID=UPI00053C199D|nr:PREDICTED: TMV resistance protein N-like isoform X1 [Tarenaya hassleriana]